MDVIGDKHPYLDPVHDYCAWDPLSYLPPEEASSPVYADLDFISELCIRRDEIMNHNGVVGTFQFNDYVVFGMEVGDDRADASRNPLNLAMALSCQEKVLDMKTSQEDTYISNTMWNFTEVSNCVPCTPEGSFHHARRVGSFKNLEYTDTVILRLIVDCSKGDSSHSSTAVGKAGMLASRLNTPRDEHRSELHLASYIQDASLRTGYSPDPKYLPNIMGGSGARALFDNPTNLYLSVKAYRGGGYDRLYGSATQEVRQCLGSLDRGIGATPVLCHRLRDRQEYLHGTYADKILIPPLRSMKRGVEALPDPLYESVGNQNRFQSVEARLTRTKALIGRRDAERELEKTLKTHEALIGTTSSMYAFEQWKRNRSAARRKFDSALQANSAFIRLLTRCANGHEVETLIREGFLSVGCGVTKFSKWDAQWLFLGGKGETFTIENLTLSEDMFIREEVSTEESFKVGGIPLEFTTSGKTRVEVTSCRVGLYQINNSMLSWSNDIVERLKTRREELQSILLPSDLLEIFGEDLEWVNDDTMLIAKCLRDTENMTNAFSVLLVSNDRRLANQMANTANITVYRVGPSDVICNIHREVWDSSSRIGVEELMPFLSSIRTGEGYRKPVAVYIDTGSLASACSKLWADESQLPGDRITYQRELIGYGVNDAGYRYSNYRLLPIVGSGRVRCETFRSLARTKRFRWGKPLRSVYGTELSTRNSVTSSDWRSVRSQSMASSVAA
nr:MAG: RNA-dependent RNA polymerase [Dracophyllum associated narna-like virus 3]